MPFTFVPVLTDDAREVQSGRSNFQGEFFERFATRTSIGRFAVCGVEFSTTRAPQAAVWRLRALHKQHLVLWIEAIEEGRNVVSKARTGVRRHHSCFGTAASG